MSTTQKLILIGHLGRDPDVRVLPSGDSVANANVAVTETWKDKAGNKQEKTTWFRCAFWGKLAGIAENYLRKGSLIYVEGTVEASAYASKEGEPQASLEVRVREMKMLSSGKRQEEGDAPQSAATPQRAAPPRAAAPVSDAGFGDDEELSDDLDKAIPY